MEEAKRVMNHCYHILFFVFFVFLFHLCNSTTHLDHHSKYHGEPNLAVIREWTVKQKQTTEMVEAKGLAKHVVISKYKDGVSQEKIDEIIKGFANLVNLVPPMKSFRWGKDVSTQNMNEGYTHIFESTFESVEGIAEFLVHPAHLEFANWSVPCLEKVMSIDFTPTIVNL